MGRKNKQPWGVMPIWVNKKDRQEALEVPGKMDIPLTPVLQEELENAIAIFMSDKSYSTKPPVSELKKMLQDLGKASGEFIKALKQFDNQRIARYLDLDLSERMQLRHDALEVAEIFQNAAYLGSLNIAKDKSVKGKDVALIKFLESLRNIYAKATGKEANASSSYKTEFILFAYKVLDELKHPYSSEEALSKFMIRNL